jgi:hypothetical protein
MEILPNEVMVEIMFKLSFRSFQNMGAACKRFHEIYQTSKEGYQKLYPYIFDLKLALFSHINLAEKRTFLCQQRGDNDLQLFFMDIDHLEPYKLTIYRIDGGKHTSYYPDEILQKYMESQELENLVRSPVTFLSDEEFLKLKEFLKSKNIKTVI